MSDRKYVCRNCETPFPRDVQSLLGERDELRVRVKKIEGQLDKLLDACEHVHEWFKDGEPDDERRDVWSRVEGAIALAEEVEK